MYKMTKIEWSTTVMPAAEIIAVCSSYRKEIIRARYNDYHDHANKMKELETRLFECPWCKKIFKKS